MINTKKAKIVLFLCVISVALIFSGCPGKNDQQMPNQQDSRENKKNPDKLKGIETSVETMISELSGIKQKEQEEQQGKQEEQQGGSESQGDTTSQEQGNSSQGSQKGDSQPSSGKSGGQESNNSQVQGEKQQGSSQQQGGGQQGKQEMEKSELLGQKPEINWQKILKDTEKIHTQWNDYISQAAKDGVAKSNIDGFSSWLNELTTQLTSKNRNAALLAANNLNLYLTNFWESYNSKVPTDIKKLKHYIRNVIYYSDFIQWLKAEENLKTAKNLFQNIRAAADEQKQDEINKTDFSIQELERVVKRQKPSLVRLKGKLALDNLIAIEKELEEAQ